MGGGGGGEIGWVEGTAKWREEWGVGVGVFDTRSSLSLRVTNCMEGCVSQTIRSPARTWRRVVIFLFLGVDSLSATDRTCPTIIIPDYGRGRHHERAFPEGHVFVSIVTALDPMIMAGKCESHEITRNRNWNQVLLYTYAGKALLRKYGGLFPEPINLSSAGARVR